MRLHLDNCGNFGELEHVYISYESEDEAYVVFTLESTSLDSATLGPIQHFTARKILLDVLGQMEGGSEIIQVMLLGANLELNWTGDG